MYFPKGYKVGHTWMETQMNFYHQILTSLSNFFESETHFVRHSWTHLRLGVNTHKSSNTHASCLFLLSTKKHFCACTQLSSFHLFHLTLDPLCKVSESALPSPKTTPPGLWFGAVWINSHSEASLRSHTMDTSQWTGHISHLIPTFHHQGSPVL